MWKKGKYVLFEMTFITSIGNAGDLHTLTILLVISSLSERELGRCVLLGHLCQQPLLCSIEKGRPGRFFQQVSFLLVCWYETQPLRSEIWRCVSNRHQKFIVFCTVVIFMWLIFKDWIPMAASQAGTLATKPKGPSRPWQDFAWNCLTQLPRQVGSCQTDGHLRTKGETPARTDQRRKSQRRQLLFKLFVASGAPSGAFVLKTQLETQARAAEQMDSSCSVCLHLPNELLPAPRRFPSALESRRSWRAGCLSGRRRDWDRFWGRLGVMLGDTRLWGLEGDLNLKPLHWTSGNPSKGAGIASRHYRVPPRCSSLPLFAPGRICQLWLFSHLAAFPQLESAHPQRSWLLPPPKNSIPNHHGLPLPTFWCKTWPRWRRFCYQLNRARTSIHPRNKLEKCCWSCVF